MRLRCYPHRSWMTSQATSVMIRVLLLQVMQPAAVAQVGYLIMHLVFGNSVISNIYRSINIIVRLSFMILSPSIWKQTSQKLGIETGESVQ